MSGITIALFLVTKQTAVLLTGGTLLLCALVGIFVLTQAFLLLIAVLLHTIMDMNFTVITLKVLLI